MSKLPSDTEAMEQALDGRAESRYSLTLFVTGATPASLHAIRNVRRLCDTRLAGRCDLSIVDIYRRPELARDEQIIVVPTLTASLPRAQDDRRSFG